MEENMQKWNHLRLPNPSIIPVSYMADIIINGDGINIDQPFYGFPVLFHAVNADDVVVVRQILQEGADANKTADYTLPLHIICLQKLKNTLEIAVLLLDYGADQLMTVDDTGCVPLHLAFFKRKSDLMELLLRRLPKGVNPADRRTNFSAFHIACAQGLDDVVLDMLENGIQIDHCAVDSEENQFNGLYFAILDNRKSTVELLLQRGANAKNFSVFGKTLMHVACLFNIEKVAAEYDRVDDIKFESIQRNIQNQLDIIDLLLDHGVDINGTNKDSLPPMLYIFYTRLRSDILNNWREKFPPETYFFHEHIICKYRYNINKYRCQHPRRRLIVQHLLERGAAVNSISLQIYFQAPYRDVYRIDAEITKLLINHGADVNSRDERYCTPLHSIVDRLDCYKVHTNKDSLSENITILLDHGANVNAVDINGRTPISLLIRNCDLLIDNDDNKNVGLESLKVLLVHAQRLLTLGLPVHREIKDSLEKRREIDLYDLASVEKKCADELTRMKQIQVDAQTSLYQLLRTGRDESGQCLTELELDLLLKKYEMPKEYPHYAKLFEFRIKREQCLQRAEPAMRFIADCELPHLCVEAIFQYLSNFELQNLAKVGFC